MNKQIQKSMPEHQKSKGDKTNYPEKVENHFGNWDVCLLEELRCVGAEARGSEQ